MIKLYFKSTPGIRKLLIFGILVNSIGLLIGFIGHSFVSTNWTKQFPLFEEGEV
ncbi:hypothetical protein J6TS1_18280 [Siminovitchia terrae]|uniref:ABC transporter permease n=1 Tax=Siminovitchia terrae TaxID=1914933 RepID=A0ABQ4KV93_SIMTE|nr:hypothetical protein J22TS1_47870 [Siminovitchia terrae]GIN95958.1 hypothetical protein J6TS1_18280 [Siminovitchia terrae]